MNIFLDLFLTYFKIGLFTIGGGYAMIPLIQQEVVVNHGWLTMSELTDFIAVAESTPGPFAINTATFVGIKIAGLPGAALTTFGVVLPSLVIILIIAKSFHHFKDNVWVQACLYGMTAVVIGLIAAAIYSLCVEIFAMEGGNLALDIKSLVICALCCVAYFKVKVGPIPLIFIAAAAGLVAYGLLPVLGL